MYPDLLEKYNHCIRSFYNSSDQTKGRKFIREIANILSQGVGRFLLIPEQCQVEDVHMGEGYLKVLGKGDKERIVPIGKFVQMELLHYIEKVRPQPYGGDCDKLFLSRGGKPITVNTVKLVFC